jgi:hypothetical protein
MQTYTPTDFVAKLSANELPEPLHTTFVGLAKYDREKPQAIQFSWSSSCQQWLTVPMDMIETVHHLGSVPCQDHQHPLVKMTCKRPDESRADLVFLFHMLSQLQGAILRIASASKKGVKIMSTSDCYWLIVEGQVYVCCGDPPECTGVAVV